MTSHRSWALLGAVSVLGLALGACGSSSGGNASSPTTSGTAAASTTTTTMTQAADLALAKRSLVVLGDLPSGWTASGEISSGGGSGSNVPLAEIATCLGVPASEIQENEPTENSPTFNDPTKSASVDDQVEVFPSATAAGIDFSTFANPKAPKCVAGILATLVKQGTQNNGGTKIGTITATRESFPDVGDHSGAIQLEVPVLPGDTSVFFTIAVITRGPLETTLALSSTGTPFSAAVAQQVAHAAVNHMS
jgi:hypothetical protein